MTLWDSLEPEPAGAEHEPARATGATGAAGSVGSDRAAEPAGATAAVGSDRAAEPAGTTGAAAEDPAPAERTWTVAEVGTEIRAGLRRAFPAEVWVRGEIHGYRKPNRTGHCYFDLAEPGAAPGERPDAKVSVALFRGARARVDAALAAIQDAAVLADGVQVRIRAKVDWWIEGGQLRLVMADIDPVFTLGQLDEQRRRLLADLAAEGLLDRNATVPMPLVPLRIGLVTSAGSAAHADFVEELRASRYAFEVVLVDARVQGVDAPRSIVAALATLATRDVDVVALVRGGGSRTDLAAFDHADIARAIATFPRPVLTGIGHEIDRSVADEVAHRSAKTPTAVAALLVRLVGEVDAALDDRHRRLARHAERHLDAARRHLTTTTRDVARVATGAAVRARSGLDARAERVDRSARGRLGRAATHLDGAAAQLTRRSRQRLTATQDALDVRAQRLPEQARRTLERAGRSLDARAAQVRAHDPAHVLARGWSLTRTADGALVRDAATLEPGTALTTTLAHGTVHSTVDRTNRVDDRTDDARPEPPQGSP